MITCKKCLDVGVVELTQGEFKTLALCDCSQGQRQPWALPTAPMRGFIERPLNWRDFRHSNSEQREQKTIGWLETVQIAVDFWESQKPRDEEEAV